MYVWIWRHLPGGLPGRLVGSLLLLLLAVLVLFVVVFPRVEPLLPYSDVTVDRSPTPAATAPATPETSASSAP